MSKKERDFKRRDSKGRLLKSGESQRTDRRYTYTSRLLPPLANCPVLRSIFTVTIPGGGVSGCSGMRKVTAP